MADLKEPARMRATVSRDGEPFRHMVQVRDHQLVVDEPIEKGGADAAEFPAFQAGKNV